MSRSLPALAVGCLLLLCNPLPLIAEMVQPTHLESSRSQRKEKILALLNIEERDNRNKMDRKKAESYQTQKEVGPHRVWDHPVWAAVLALVLLVLIVTLTPFHVRRA